MTLRMIIVSTYVESTLVFEVSCRELHQYFYAKHYSIYTDQYASINIIIITNEVDCYHARAACENELEHII